tara:strand:+ start:1016 stop:1582 length:567 start_codon:yes stop_codon:yes gene_type:complete
MDISEIIRKRRAIYPSQFESGNIDDSIIKLLLENANTAPTHKLTQPWFFKIYKGKFKDILAEEMIISYKEFYGKELISTVKKKKIFEKCKQSNCIISVFMKRDPNNSVPEWEEIAATAMAVQNIWLTCAAKNIGCYWSTPKYCIKMNDFFNLNNDEKSLGFIYLGKFDHSKVKTKNRKSIHQKTEWKI